MKGIYIKGTDIYLKDLTEAEAVIPYMWYSTEKGYSHATGLNTGLSWPEFLEMLNDSAKKENNFFLAIYQTKSNSISGFIKGTIFEGATRIFINALAVDKSKRHVGIGTHALDALISNFKFYGCNSVYVTVDAENKTGLKFWNKNGFCNLRVINRKNNLNNTVKSIILMERIIA